LTRPNAAVVLMVALVAWILASGLFYTALTVLRPDDADKRQD
jgi:hypothetical protein